MLEVAIAAGLILLNGVFALSELAVVSSRAPRLQAMARRGRRGAAAALALSQEPGRFLSTVQIGITLVGILAGAFSGATLGARLSVVLEGAGMAPALADTLGFVIVIAIITYLSVIVGELIPKHLALRDPEGVAAAVAPLMTLLARAAAPVVWVLDASTRLVLRLFGQSAGSRAAVTEEEIRTVVAEAESAGTIERSERRMISGVLRLGERTVRGIMTPRTEISFLDVQSPPEALRLALMSNEHTIVPVVDGAPDNVIGVVDVTDILAVVLAKRPIDLRKHLRQAPVVPDTIDALQVVELLRLAPVAIALVYDEYGNLQGLVTPSDALKVIVGRFNADEERDDDSAVRRADGSWLLAGSLPADEMADLLGLQLPDEREYETLAGLVLETLGRLPETGESVGVSGWTFEVVDMDGRRIDKVLARPASPPPAAEV